MKAGNTEITVTVNSGTVNAQIIESAVRSAGGDVNAVTTIVLGRKARVSL